MDQDIEQEQERRMDLQLLEATLARQLTWKPSLAYSPENDRELEQEETDVRESRELAGRPSN